SETINYNARGLVDSREIDDGLGNTAGTRVMHYDYDGLGRRTSQFEDVNGGDAETATYSIDDADRVHAVARSMDSATMWAESYDFDPLGRRRNKTEYTNVTITSTGYMFDRLGDLASMGIISLWMPLQTTTYSYDLAGHLLKETYPDSVDPTIDAVRFEYD